MKSMVPTVWFVFWGTAFLSRSLVGQEAEGWKQFRGPQGAGRSTRDLPIHPTIDIKRQQIWKAETLPGHSSPIVVGENLFFTGYREGSLVTIALALKDGSLRWQKSVPVDSFEKTHPQHGPATPTPTSDGKHLFVVFGSVGVLAYDLQGNELWRRDWQKQKNLFGTASSPVLFDQKLIVIAGNEEESLLQALRPEEGTVLWERRRRGPASTWSTPTLWKQGSRSLLLFYEPFHLRACALDDGADVWSIPGLADEPVTTPQISEGKVFVTSYNLRTNREALGLPTFEALLKECDADHDGAISTEEARTNKTILSRPDADGQGDHPLRMFIRLLDEDRDGSIRAEEWPRIHRWIDPWDHANGVIAIDLASEIGGETQAPPLAWQFGENVPECPTPICWGKRIFFVRNGGVVTSLKTQDGTKVFSERLAGGGPYYASPVAMDNKIFFASARGVVSIVSTEDTPLRLGQVDLGEPIFATPAIVDQQLIVRTEKHIYLFDMKPRG